MRKTAAFTREQDVDMEPAAGDAPAPTVKTRRRCLRCAAMFDSTWFGERICPTCKHSSTWRAGQPASIYPARPKGGSRRPDR
jgi:hypothetical protein